MAPLVDNPQAPDDSKNKNTAKPKAKGRSAKDKKDERDQSAGSSAVAVPKVKASKAKAGLSTMPNDQPVPTPARACKAEPLAEPPKAVPSKAEDPKDEKPKDEKSKTKSFGRRAYPPEGDARDRWVAQRDLFQEFIQHVLVEHGFGKITFAEDCVQSGGPQTLSVDLWHVCIKGGS